MTNIISPNFLSITEKLKNFRIALFKKNKEDAFQILDLILNETTLNKVIQELISIWIEYYLYKTFFLGIIFISLFDIKISKTTKPYILCLLKYLVNILLLYDYDNDIIKLDKVNVLGYENVNTLKSVEITESKFALFDLKKSTNDTNNLGFKALYISYKNKNKDFLIKSLNTLLLNNDQISAIHSIWHFLLHNEEIYEYSSQLGFKIFESKYTKKSHKFIVLYYIFLIHIDYFEQDYLNKVEITIDDINSFKDTYMHDKNKDDEDNNQNNEPVQYVVVKSDDKYNEIKTVSPRHNQQQYHHQPQYNKQHNQPYHSKSKDKKKYDKYKQNNSSNKYDKYTNYIKHHQQSHQQSVHINTQHIVSNLIQEQKAHPIKQSQKEIKEQAHKQKQKKINDDMSYLFNVVPIKEEQPHEKTLNIDNYMSYIPTLNK